MSKIEQVHQTSYLLSTDIDLSDLAQDKVEVFDLYKGYEIINLSIEVIQEDANATQSIDVGTVADSSFFLNDIAITKKEHFKSKVEATIQDDTCLVLETQARKGKVKIRMLYFTPGKMLR